MKKILVPCNHCKNNEIPANIPFDEKISINASPPNQNLQLHIHNITHRIISELNPLAQDLLEIAAYVYYADCSAKRGTEKDVYADLWRRKFHFVIPVSNPNKWNTPEIKNLLVETLEFLSDDEFLFTFIPPKPEPVQLFFKYPDMPPPFPKADCICLFSGGIDSLIGTLFLLKIRNEYPLLISHRSVPIMDNRQKNLVRLIQERNKEWPFPHLSIWINRRGIRAIEVTQRTRSFLYLSIAASVASQLGMRKIYICENGIVSINIPISGQNVGTLLTRSTHPKFLEYFERLIRNLFEADLSIENPFIFNTKSQMLYMLKGWNQGELIEAAISCAYTQGKTKMQPQCGTCFQCVNRRFSIIAAGLEEYDKSEFYEKDMFLDPLSEGKESFAPISYVRTALDINEVNDIQFFAKYPELIEVVNGLNISPEDSGQKIYDLFQCHANEVIEVVTSKFNLHTKELLAGKLPENCLISMLAQLHHLKNPLDVYADKIARILGRSLRIQFQSEKPKNERQIQESTQAIIAGHDEDLRRESPSLSYTVVQTKPDFGKLQNFGWHLFIEMKFLNSRNKLNKIVTEITSRITIYRDQGAFVLFVVYDTDDFIKDDDEFICELEKHDKIKVKIIR